MPVIVAPAGDAPSADGHFNAAPAAEWIEIALAGGVRVTVDGTADVPVFPGITSGLPPTSLVKIRQCNGLTSSHRQRRLQ